MSVMLVMSVLGPQRGGEIGAGRQFDLHVHHSGHLAYIRDTHAVKCVLWIMRWASDLCLSDVCAFLYLPMFSVSVLGTERGGAIGSGRQCDPRKRVQPDGRLPPVCRSGGGRAG